MLQNVWYLRTAFLAAAFLGLTSQAGDTNYTVDDFERSRIDFTPIASWNAISNPSTQDRFRQTTTFTSDQGAFATFRFKGNAIYYGGYGELVNPPDTPGEIRVQLDDAIHDVSANTIPAKPAQQILFSQTGLDPTKQHIITVQKTSESGKRDLNIDFFIYTVPDGMNDTNIPAANSTADATQKMGPPTGVLVGGILGGVLGGLLIVALTLWFFKRKKNKSNFKNEFIIDTDPRQPLTSDVPPNSEYIPSPYPLTKAQYYPPTPSTSTGLGDPSPKLIFPTSDGSAHLAVAEALRSSTGLSHESSSSHGVNNRIISLNEAPPPGYTAGGQQIPTHTAAIPMRKIRGDRSAEETRREDRL